MARKKPYFDGCAAAHALDLVGERWALLIVRELVPGPKRFTDLKAALPGISTNILTTRLAELEATAIVARRSLPPPAAAQTYTLTRWGAGLEPIIRELGRWAASSPTLAPGKPMSVASVMLSLRTMFDAKAAGGLDASLSLVLGGIPHRATVQDGVFSIEQGNADQANCIIRAEPDLLVAVIYGGMPLEEAQREGMEIEGDIGIARHFTRLFPLPETAPL